MSACRDCRESGELSSCTTVLAAGRRTMLRYSASELPHLDSQTTRQLLGLHPPPIDYQNSTKITSIAHAASWRTCTYRFLPYEATTTMATTSLGGAVLSRAGTKGTATIQRVSDTAVYPTDRRVADLDIEGETVRMSREVADFWCHPRDPVRLVPVEGE